MKQKNTFIGLSKNTDEKERERKREKQWLLQSFLCYRQMQKHQGKFHTFH